MFEHISAPVSRAMGSIYAHHTTWRDCPCCGYKNSLAITQSQGKELYHCHAGCSQADLWRVIRGEIMPEHRQPVKTTPRVANESGKVFALRLWRESLSGGDGLVPMYLASRGLVDVVPVSIRFLPKHLHKPSGTHWPVMLASAVDCDGQIQAVHRTYLASDGKGKAQVEPAKMTLGAVGGLACHLGEVGEELAVAEGIETALSVQFGTGIPAWAALSAGGIRNLILPPLPLASVVTIAADNDPVGMRSAQEAAHRWREEGRKVRIAVPPEGTDFNDVLKGAA